MDIPALDRVECAILHEEFNPLDGNVIFQAIQRLSRELNYAPEVQLIVSSTRKDVHVHANGHRILVSQNTEPLEPEGFRTALSTPYTGFVLPNAHDVVMRHKANTFITIAKGFLDSQLLREKFGSLLDGLDNSIDDQTSFKTLEEADRARTFCYALAKLIIGHNPAIAIHWCVSDNLVPQTYFEGVAKDGDYTLLNIRPFLSSSAGRLGEGLPLKMVVHGSQWIIGKMIEFEEAPVPFPWMMEIVYGFIKLCQIRGSILPDNNTFGNEDEDWSVAVYHEKIEGHSAWDKVRLVVVHAPEFGIFGDTTAKRYHRYESAEDIRQRAEEEKHEVTAANDPQPYDRRPDPTAEPAGSGDRLPPQAEVANDTRREIKITQQKQDLSALRDFARRSSTSDQASSDDPQQSWLSRAKGLFKGGR
ncbi:hypothetical protein [uncultured Roseibium sp.]|uniref:hypothetical protein n=1 Tax=uncultured Roseibium sp. TaxID=1936171 RepID=UPI00262C1AAD|nr:hypothetical protein [uncultured Roseibium sp.]